MKQYHILGLLNLYHSYMESRYSFACSQFYWIDLGFAMRDTAFHPNMQYRVLLRWHSELCLHPSHATYKIVLAGSACTLGDQDFYPSLVNIVLQSSIYSVRSYVNYLVINETNQNIYVAWAKVRKQHIFFLLEIFLYSSVNKWKHLVKMCLISHFLENKKIVHDLHSHVS
jgi:hypothetical protein